MFSCMIFCFRSPIRSGMTVREPEWIGDDCKRCPVKPGMTGYFVNVPMVATIVASDAAVVEMPRMLARLTFFSRF